MGEAKRASSLGHDDLEILRLLAHGLTVESIALRLNMSERTVTRKIRAVVDAVGVDSTIEAIVWAVREDLI